MQNTPSRRQSRSRRADADRLWRDGLYDENAPDLERWSREAKTKGPKVKKRMDISESVSGTVLEVNRKTCRILDEKGEIQNCEILKGLDLKKFYNLGVGDRVMFQPDAGNSGVILKVEERNNTIYRMGPSDRKWEKIILAANVDQIIVVLSFQDPGFNGKQLDRFLVRINSVPAKKIICLNKSDLSENIPAEIPYLEKLGWQVQILSAIDGTGIPEFWEQLKGQKNLFMGPSGVGKSSLIKLFARDDGIKTQEVREVDGRGRHTTTRSHAYLCPENTWIIDSPGIRELVVWDLTPEEVLEYFSEFARLTSEPCRFRDCVHLDEAGCAVRRSVYQEKIPEFRYDSYRRIVGNSQRNQ